MKKKIKWLTLLVTVCMLLTLFPTTVMASETNRHHVLESGSAQSGEGWSWNGSILTLNNFHYEGAEAETGNVFYIDGDANVSLVGENSFKGEANLNFIYATGALTLNGNGELSANNSAKFGETYDIQRDVFYSDTSITFNSGTYYMYGQTTCGGDIIINGGILNVTTSDIVYSEFGYSPVNAFYSLSHIQVNGGIINLQLGKGSTGFAVFNEGGPTTAEPNILITACEINSKNGDQLIIVAYMADRKADNLSLIHI